MKQSVSSTHWSVQLQVHRFVLLDLVRKSWPQLYWPFEQQRLKYYLINSRISSLCPKITTHPFSCDLRFFSEWQMFYVRSMLIRCRYYRFLQNRSYGRVIIRLTPASKLGGAGFPDRSFECFFLNFFRKRQICYSNQNMTDSFHVLPSACSYNHSDIRRRKTVQFENGPKITRTSIF